MWLCVWVLVLCWVVHFFSVPPMNFLRLVFIVLSSLMPLIVGSCLSMRLFAWLSSILVSSSSFTCFMWIVKVGEVFIFFYKVERFK